MQFDEAHPIILPRDHHLTKLIIEFAHRSVHHQGRHVTHGAKVIELGVYVHGVKRIIRSILALLHFMQKTETKQPASTDGRFAGRTDNTIPAIHTHRIRCIRTVENPRKAEDEGGITGRENDGQSSTPA